MAIDNSSVMPAPLVSHNATSARTGNQTPAASSNSAAASSPSVTELQDAAAQLQNHLNLTASGAEQFSVDYLSGLGVMTIRDATTGSVIRQIPSANALELARVLTRTGALPKGALVDLKT